MSAAGRIHSCKQRHLLPGNVLKQYQSGEITILPMKRRRPIRAGIRGMLIAISMRKSGACKRPGNHTAAYFKVFLSLTNQIRAAMIYLLKVV